MKKNITKIVLLILIVISIFSLDLFTKYLIEENIRLDESVKIIKNFFSLTYVRNTGAAFSIFSGKVNLLIVISLVILFYLVYEMYLYFKVPIFPYFIAVLVGGLTGNLYDRIIYGYVRDFLDFNIFGYKFAIFNISDTFVVLGTFLLIVLLITKGDINENNNKKRTDR